MYINIQAELMMPVFPYYDEISSMSVQYIPVTVPIQL